MVQTSFLFYGGLTTLFLTIFAIRFDVFDGTLGRTLVGNLAFIGFGQLPAGRFCSGPISSGGGLAGCCIDDGVSGCAGHRMARCGDWRDSRVRRISDKRGTFTRSVTVAFVVSVFIMLLCGVKRRSPRRSMAWASSCLSWSWVGHSQASPSAVYRLAAEVGRVWRRLCRHSGGHHLCRPNRGQVEEGGWIRLLTFTTLFVSAHLLLLSPLGIAIPSRFIALCAIKRVCEGHGLDRRVAVVEDARVSLWSAGGNQQLLGDVWHPPAGALRSAGGCR